MFPFKKFFLNIRHTKHNHEKHFVNEKWKERGVVEHFPYV